MDLVEIIKGLPSGLRGRSPEEFRSIYVQDRIAAHLKGRQSAASTGPRAGAFMRTGKERRARSRRFMEAGAARMPAGLIPAKARASKPAGGAQGNRAESIALNPNKRNKLLHQRNDELRRRNMDALVEGEQAAIQRWRSAP